MAGSAARSPSWPIAARAVDSRPRPLAGRGRGWPRRAPVDGADERLEQSGERATVRAAHARYFLALAAKAEPELTGADQVHWLERLEAECANLRFALEGSLSHGEPAEALQLAGIMAMMAGDHDGAMPLPEESVARFEAPAPRAG